VSVLLRPPGCAHRGLHTRLLPPFCTLICCWHQHPHQSTERGQGSALTHTHTHTHVHAPNTTCTGACTCFHSCALLLFPSAVAARHWCEWAKQRGQWWCAVAAAKFHATVTHCGGHRCSKGESLFEMPHCVAQSGFASLVCSCNCTCSCHFTYSSGFLRWVP
jgi:hypothetical protein